MEKLYQQVWIDLPKETRDHLAKVFNIQKTGITEVRDQTVVSDGYTNLDLSVLTADKMSAYVGSPTGSLTFSRLWEIVLSKVKYELHPPMMEIQSDGLVVTVPPPKYCNTCISTKGRHRKGCPKFK